MFPGTHVRVSRSETQPRRRWRLGRKLIAFVPLHKSAHGVNVLIFGGVKQDRRKCRAERCVVGRLSFLSGNFSRVTEDGERRGSSVYFDGAPH